MARSNLALVREGDTTEPTPPEHLTPLGAEWWRAFVADLMAQGVAGQVDAHLVEQAAEMYEGRRVSQATVKKHGALLQGAHGLKKNPAVQKQLEYAREFRQVIKMINRQLEAATPETDGDDSPFDFG